METIWLTVFTGIQIVAIVIAEQSKVYVYNGRLSWINSSTVCQLAKPKILFSEDGVSLEIETDLVKTDTWVGYVPRFVILKYQGCYENVTLSTKAVWTYKTHLKVADCFSACGTTYFAIGGDKTCLCLVDIKNMSSVSGSSCDKECDKLLCGSGNGVHMSVYAEDADSSYTAPPEINPACFTYDRNLTLASRECDDNANIGGLICAMNNKTEWFCDVVSGNKKWFELTKNYPTKCENTSSNCRNVSESNGIFWSLLIGAWVVRANQTQSTQEYGDRPKYVSFVNTKRKLQITTKLDQTYSALCENTSMSTTTSITSIEVHTTDYAPVVSTTIGSKELTTRHSIVSEPFINITKSTQNKTGVYVGIGIGIAAIGTLIVSSTVLRKRICKLMSRKPKCGETKFPHVTFDNARESQRSGDATPITPSVSAELPNYFILEPSSDEATRNQLHQTSTSDADDESSYDVCKQNRFIDTQQSTNVRNVAGQSDIPFYQGLYDCTNINRGNRDIKNGTKDGNYDSLPAAYDGNTYDIHDAGHMIEELKNRSENIYDTAGNRMSDGSIYDHTVDPRAREAADENMYGHISFDVTDNDIDNTYNHINSCLNA